MRELMTGKEAAEKLGVTQMTLAKWRRMHGIAHYKIGANIMYASEDLDAFIEGRHVSSKDAVKKAKPVKKSAGMKAKDFKKAAAKK